jgi:hypothetical protein
VDQDKERRTENRLVIQEGKQTLLEGIRPRLTYSTIRNSPIEHGPIDPQEQREEDRRPQGLAGATRNYRRTNSTNLSDTTRH